MLDKLKLITKEELAPDLLHRRLGEIATQTKGNLDRLYLCSRTYIVNGQHIVLKTNGKQSNISPVCVELNPSSFSGLSELVGAIESFIDPSILRISRVDHTVDLPVKYTFLKNKIDVKFKVMRSDFHGTKPTGMMIGRGNETICIYDKTEQAKLEYDLTRIELREKFGSVGVSKLSDLSLLLNIDPFTKIRIMDIGEPNNNGSPRCYLQLRDSIEAKGLLLARKELSCGNNFTKTFEKYLVPSEYDGLMRTLYMENLSKFLRS